MPCIYPFGAAALLILAIGLSCAASESSAFSPDDCYEQSHLNATLLWSQYLNTTAFRTCHPTLDEWYTNWATQDYAGWKFHPSRTWSAMFDDDCQPWRNQTIVAYDIPLPRSLSRTGVQYRYTLWLSVSAAGEAHIWTACGQPEELIATVEDHPQVAEFAAFLGEMWPSERLGYIRDNNGPPEFAFPDVTPSMEIGSLEIETADETRVTYAYLALNHSWTTYPSVALSRTLLEAALASRSCVVVERMGVVAHFFRTHGLRHEFAMTCPEQHDYIDVDVWLYPQNGTYAVLWDPPNSVGPIAQGNLSPDQLDALHFTAPRSPATGPVPYANTPQVQPPLILGLFMLAMFGVILLTRSRASHTPPR